MNFLYSVTSKYIHFSQLLMALHACEIFETSHITFWKSFAQVFLFKFDDLTVKEIICVQTNLYYKSFKILGQLSRSQQQIQVIKKSVSAWKDLILAKNTMNCSS